jgi:hypothetical protein
LEQADGQRQSYNRTASRPIGNPSHAPVRLDNCIHKRKSETVPRRMFSLYEALKSPTPDIRRESRTIIFNHQFCRPLMRMEPNAHPASRGQVSQFVFKQIAYYTIQQRQVSIYDHMPFEINRHFVMALSHSRLVDINQLSHNIGEIDWATIHVKRTGLGLGKIERGVQQLQEPIKVFDRFPNRVTPLLISFIA